MTFIKLFSDDTNKVVTQDKNNEQGLRHNYFSGSMQRQYTMKYRCKPLIIFSLIKFIKIKRYDTTAFFRKHSLCP